MKTYFNLFNKRPKFLLGQSGFTFLELLAIIAIIGVLAGLAAPAFGNLVSKIRVTSVANDFIGIINYARGEALARGTIVTLEPRGVGWGTGANISYRDSANVKQNLRNFTLSSGTSVSPTGNVGQIFFSSRGVVSATGLTFPIKITVSNGNVTKYIKLEQSGLSFLED